MSTTSHNLKNIDIEAFQEEIINSSLYTNPADNVNEFIVQYNTVLKGILDAHTPEKRKKVVLHPQAPWFTDDILEAKQVRRRADRRWRKSKLVIDLEIVCDAQPQVTNKCAKAKSEYICGNWQD